MTSRIYILDVDGTIVDFFPRHYKIIKDFSDEFGCQHKSFQDYRQQRRNWLSDIEIFQNINPNFNVETYKKFKLAKIEDAKYLKLDTVFPSVIKTLDYIAKKATIILITARKKRKMLKKELKGFGIDHHKTVIHVDKNASVSEIKKVYRKIKKFGNLKDAIYVGDGKDDACLSKALSIPFIGVVTGISNRQKLKSLHPQKIINSISMLIIN